MFPSYRVRVSVSLPFFEGELSQMRFFSTDPVLKKTEAFEFFFCFHCILQYGI